ATIGWKQSIAIRQRARGKRRGAPLSPYADSERVLAGSPLRRPPRCTGIFTLLVVGLLLPAFVHMTHLLRMRPDVLRAFFRARFPSPRLAAVPLAALWSLDRRERETPWLFAAAFLWGGCIATGLALPFNSAFFALMDVWVARPPVVEDLLGPNAAILL